MRKRTTTNARQCLWQEATRTCSIGLAISRGVLRDSRIRLGTSSESTGERLAILPTFSSVVFAVFENLAFGVLQLVLRMVVQNRNRDA